MKIDFNEVTQTFAARCQSGDIEELQDAYSALMARVLPYIEVPPGGEWGDQNRIRSYAMAYRQVLLHRAISLFEGSLKAAIDENAYVMILAIRASFETTAALGYLHNRLASLVAGNLESKQVDKDIMSQILGTKDTYIPQAMPPKQILTMLEYADVSVSKKIMGGQAKEHKILLDSYNFLCEFAHPNFHSNNLAFKLDKPHKRIVFSYGERLQEEALSNLGYLLLSAPIHVELHDDINKLLLDVS